MTRLIPTESNNSHNLEQLHQLHERRHAYSSDISLYERLSLAQKVSACHLQQFGFELKFIRGKQLNCLAIFICNKLSVTVDVYGEINSFPHSTLEEEIKRQLVSEK
ncbi:hypothetical protein CXF85_22490 [Colwellia sp. 75C3]|uniref:hypothetical protein n=1 Tax=Colwellia sp. 75C3 TaxID=888425 RepID=UPI000C33BBC9|nr:hypothetical protein [Colwellia sp. 75C3]PKG80874.1 hypothetical protein CXF85_22490 [Colwellia sp. 75C3]